MKPRAEWRTRSLLTFLVDDPWRKLASLALAVAVWLWLSAQTDERLTMDLDLSTESAEGQQWRRNELRLSVPRDQLLVTGFSMSGQDSQPVHKVQVTVSGQKQYVQLVQERGIGFVVLPHENERAAGRVDITASRLTLDYMRDPMERDKLTFELSPARIEAHLSRLAQQSITLDIEKVQPRWPEREDQRNRIQWREAQFSPGQVTLVGPKSAIDDLPQGPLFSVDLARPDLDKLPPDQIMLSPRLQLLREHSDRRLHVLETAAEVRVPLTRPYKLFTLELMPEIDFPEGTLEKERAAWKPRGEQKARLQLRSYSSALTELLSGPPDKVESWIRKNCRLKANFAAREETTGKTPVVFYIYKDGLQEFQAGQDRDYMVTAPTPVYVERVK